MILLLPNEAKSFILNKFTSHLILCLDTIRIGLVSKVNSILFNLSQIYLIRIRIDLELKDLTYFSIQTELKPRGVRLKSGSNLGMELVVQICGSIQLKFSCSNS